jgi:hypothetical protein
MAYKIQHLGLGGILDQAIAITKNHFTLLFTIMLLVMIPFELINQYLDISADLALTPDASDLEILDEADISVVEPELPAWYFPWLTLYILLYMFVVFPLTNAAVIHAVAKLYLGQPVTAVEAMKVGLRRFLPLIGTSILFSLVVMGGMILLIIPGILFAIWFGLYQHVVVLEGLVGQKALARSKKLVTPYWATFLALGLIMWIISMAAEFGPELIPQKHVQVVVCVLATAVVTIVATAAWVVFYFSCRCAAENFDLHYLAETMGAEPTPMDEPYRV